MNNLSAANLVYDKFIVLVSIVQDGQKVRSVFYCLHLSNANITLRDLS